jgi:hypothetical protein
VLDIFQGDCLAFGTVLQIHPPQQPHTQVKQTGHCPKMNAYLDEVEVFQTKKIFLEK